MSKGKRSETINSKLRRDLKEASDARARLETRLLKAEKERDELREWKIKYTDGCHPAIEAAEARVRAAILAGKEAREEERAYWKDLVERSRPVYERAASADIGLFDNDDELKALSELLDGKMMSGESRASRRNTRNEASVDRFQRVKRAAGVPSIIDDVRPRGRDRGLAAVAKAKARREAGEGSPN